MTEQLFTKTDLKASDRLKRMFKLLYLLVESFHHTSLNNECVIGALVWYVKVLFGAGNTGGHLLTQQGLIVVNAVLGNTYEQEEDRVWMQHFV